MRLIPFSKVIFANAKHPLNAVASIVSTLAGISMEVKEERTIRESTIIIRRRRITTPDSFQLRPFLKGYGCQFGTPLNAVASIVSTLAGISMEINEMQSENAPP